VAGDEAVRIANVRKIMIVAALSFPVLGKCGGVEICYSQDSKGSSVALTTELPLSCPQFGKTNLVALNKAGWSIVNVIYVGSFDPLHRSWMIVLQEK
jgi:hypothetical protein